MKTEYKQAWLALAHKKEITSSDMVALAIIKVLHKDSAEADALNMLLISFRPVTNTHKITHGHAPYFSLWQSLSSLLNRGTTFRSALGLEDKEKVDIIARKLIQQIGYAGFRL